MPPCDSERLFSGRVQERTSRPELLFRTAQSLYVRVNAEGAKDAKARGGEGSSFFSCMGSLWGDGLESGDFPICGGSWSSIPRVLRFFLGGSPRPLRFHFSSGTADQQCVPARVARGSARGLYRPKCIGITIAGRHPPILPVTGKLSGPNGTTDDSKFLRIGVSQCRHSWQ